MRIAYVTETYPPELNGVALTVERTVRHLRANGHELCLLRPRQPGEERRDDAEEWRTRSLPIPMYRDLRFGLALTATLRERFERRLPQLVHVATQGPLGRAAVQAARQLGLAVTSDFRTNFHQYSRYYGLGWMEPMVRHYLCRFHNATHRTFVPTAALREQLAGSGFAHLTVVGRGVDARLFSPQRRSAALRERWGAGEATPVLLYVGRLAAEKNVPLALAAFDAVRERLPGARMVVVGDGPMRRRWQQQHPHVHFAGLQRGEALAEHYASADLFLFPSLSDTFGNVTLEAMASGLAVVAFDVAAAAEHIEDHDSGLLVPPGDEPGFVAAACSLAWQSDTLRALRERAREAALQASWDRVLARFEDHLQETAHAVEAARSADACLA
ncbi:glycosyltransferase family 4 protein [Caldimonas tepidiphila]|uniref:glycosyltransferase family 4 protein n=1 Tax=Caldimonas tepidiphila TaxID=2315841 RepID=UPI000E5BFCA5|nr:glycosyltransferase family 1 protein [Caldimonas tepidiphila]